jgi:hypothetical protein
MGHFQLAAVLFVVRRSSRNPPRGPLAGVGTAERHRGEVPVQPGGVQAITGHRGHPDMTALGMCLTPWLHLRA